MNDHGAEDEHVAVDMLPLLENTTESTVNCSLHLFLVVFTSFPSKDWPRLLRLLTIHFPQPSSRDCRGPSPGQLPSLFCRSLCCSCCWFPHCCVPFKTPLELILPQAFSKRHPLHRKFAPMHRSGLPLRSSFLYPRQFSTLLRPLASTSLLLCLAFFLASLPRSCPVFDVSSCLMKHFCHVLPPRRLSAFSGPLFLGALTVSTRHPMRSSLFPTCAFPPSFRPGRAFVGHGFSEQPKVFLLLRTTMHPDPRNKNV